jgi:hypothetical protein
MASGGWGLMNPGKLNGSSAWVRDVIRAGIAGQMFFGMQLEAQVPGIEGVVLFFTGFSAITHNTSSLALIPSLGMATNARLQASTCFYPISEQFKGCTELGSLAVQSTSIAPSCPLACGPILR